MSILYLRLLFLAFALCPGALFSQNVETSTPATPGQLASSEPSEQKEGKRLFGIVPNFRTSPTLKNYKPISSREKFKLAGQESFDRGTIYLAAAFAGESQLSNDEPSFGHGVAAYGRYFGTSYADFVIGDYMTEAIFPSLLHQDPRYFRKGKGSGLSRAGYAAGQIVLTHTDTGAHQVNYSELVGNSSAVAIGESYYPDRRDASDAVSKLGVQLGVDMLANELKEFWPDLTRKFSRKH